MLEISTHAGVLWIIVIDVRRAVVKARILTGTYHLQADRDKFHNTVLLLLKTCSISLSHACR